MSRGLIEAGKVAGQAAGAGVSRRSFLKLGMSLGAAAGGWPAARFQPAGGRRRCAALGDRR